MRSLDEKNTNLERVHVGVRDVVIIMLLFKNTTWICAEGVLERLPFH